MPISQQEARRFGLGLPGVEESSHHGRPDLRVGGKIFATLPEGERVNTKIEPHNLEALVHRDPEVFSRVWGDRWIGIELTSAEASEVRLLLEDAWRLVDALAGILSED